MVGLLVECCKLYNFNMACRKCSKVILIVVNFMFFSACAGLIYLGIWSLREYSHYGHLASKVYMIGLPAGVIFFVGSLLFVVAITGIIATLTESKCIIATYCTSQLVTFVLLMAAIALLYSCESTVVGHLEENLATGLKHYFVEPEFTEEIDYMQLSNSCCGVNSYRDWVGTPWYNNQTFLNESFPYPMSCCPKSYCTEGTNNNSNTSANFFERGCYQALADSLHLKLIISCSVSGSVAFLLIVGFLSVCLLYRSRPMFEFVGLAEDDAIRV